MECRGIWKKAVNSAVNNGGDDLFKNRLLSYLQKQFPFQIKEIRPVRKHVYMVKAETRVFIVKGFSSYHRLRLQETFSASLKNEGFQKTYTFYDFAKEPPLFYNQTYYGCLEYLQPSDNVFSYQSQKDRNEGLNLLSAFHGTTEKLVQRYQTIVPPFNQVEKWRDRIALFLNNIPVIRYFVQKEIINELLIWADWSINGLQEESNLFHSSKKVILHGDVAHHNFLRAKNKELYLIDFDLISLGTPHSDYLQYANRILPFMNWSYQELLSYSKMKPFMKEKGFIYALAFPTDIFREWNRIIRERTYLDPLKIRPILDMTVGQFKERQKFINDLKKAAESIV